MSRVILNGVAECGCFVHAILSIVLDSKHLYEFLSKLRRLHNVMTFVKKKKVTPSQISPLDKQ